MYLHNLHIVTLCSYFPAPIRHEEKVSSQYILPYWKSGFQRKTPPTTHLFETYLASKLLLHLVPIESSRGHQVNITLAITLISGDVRQINCSQSGIYSVQSCHVLDSRRSASPRIVESPSLSELGAREISERRDIWRPNRRHALCLLKTDVYIPNPVTTSC